MTIESGIRLEFAQFGHFDSFDVIRSITSMVGVADVDLPVPIATGLKTMYYVDANVIEGTTYYYKVRVWRGTTSFLSTEVKAYAGLNFDSFVESLSPIAWLKLDEAAASGIKDSSTINHTCSVNTPSSLTPRGKILRKGHAGAMGFSIASAGVGQVTMVESPAMYNITKGSHTWFCWHHRTVSNGQNRLFGDNGDGVNKRVCWDAYEFPNNNRVIGLGTPVGTTVFMCVVYDVVAKTYRIFKNGVWYSAAYIAPPTSTTSNQTLQVPATSNAYSYYGIRGYISDLTFFNRALTDAEVETLYSLGQL